ncbi:Excinuclease ABC, A subunit, partial [Operophtera brumata]
MRKHAAYTEWADAYSCTRHRCQPGGRNLAIYTVGCLVVVRGEVWTRVLGQPWETLPAAPWSHISKATELTEAPETPDCNEPSNLQALVDAIGTRMRDIESVVQRMSDKVHDDTPRDMSSAEK